MLTLAVAILPACRQPEASAASPDTTPFVQAADTVSAGRYLIRIGGCNDCHTPGYMESQDIPESQWLVGSPVGFRGPWGTSYPKNLRLTVQTVTEDGWVQMLHTRTSLPPMPWPSVHAMSEADVRAVYRYIRSLGPAGEAAPLAVLPDQEPTTPYIDFAPQHMERLAPPTP